MSNEASDSADEIRAPSEQPKPPVRPAGSTGGNRTADDPFDRERLERLRSIADPQRPENDPLADVDPTIVSPGDGGTTGPDDVIDLDWEIDVTAAGEIADDGIGDTPEVATESEPEVG